MNEESKEISFKDLCEMYRQQMVCYRELAENRKQLLDKEREEAIELENELICLKRSINPNHVKTKFSHLTTVN